MTAKRNHKANEITARQMLNLGMPELEMLELEMMDCP